MAVHTFTLTRKGPVRLRGGRALSCRILQLCYRVAIFGGDSVHCGGQAGRRLGALRISLRERMGVRVRSVTRFGCIAVKVVTP